MVVPVLITNCQTSEYLNTGPVIPQMMMITNAIMNAVALPVVLSCPVGKTFKQINVLWHKLGINRFVTKKRPCFITTAFLFMVNNSLQFFVYIDAVKIIKGNGKAFNKVFFPFAQPNPRIIIFFVRCIFFARAADLCLQKTFVCMVII